MRHVRFDIRWRRNEPEEGVREGDGVDRVHRAIGKEVRIQEEEDGHVHFLPWL